MTVKGEAYLAEQSLILHLNIETFCKIPCSICNSPVRVPVQLKNFYHTVPLEEIRGGIYNFKELIREAILIETPHFAECNDGLCPRRQEIQKYLKDESKDTSAEEGYHPFADLES